MFDETDYMKCFMFDRVDKIFRRPPVLVGRSNYALGKVPGKDFTERAEAMKMAKTWKTAVVGPERMEVPDLLDTGLNVGGKERIKLTAQNERLKLTALMKEVSCPSSRSRRASFHPGSDARTSIFYCAPNTGSDIYWLGHLRVR